MHSARTGGVGSQATKQVIKSNQEPGAGQASEVRSVVVAAEARRCSQARPLRLGLSWLKQKLHVD